MKNTTIIAKREYLSRIRTKGFWIGTIALPLFMAAVLVLPSLLFVRTKSSLDTVVVDATGRFGEALAEEFAPKAEGDDRGIATINLTIEPASDDPAGQRRELNERVLAKQIDAWVWLDDASLERGELEYHGESVSNVTTQAELRRGISRVARRDRLRAAGYDPEEVDRLIGSIDLATVRVTEEGDRKESALVGFFAPLFLFFLLYMILILYGQQVLNGVLEEKSSRIVEVVVSTVKPYDLMMGKLLGICGVALTQLVIWLGTIALVTLPSVVGTLAWLPEDATIPRMTWPLALNFFFLFLLGFFLFSSVYAAIGAAFNNLQEAQQVASIAVFFIVAPVFFMHSVINDPDSTLAVVTSLIPFLTPLLMLLRIATKMPPLWQILLGYVLTTGCVYLMVQLAARIYRTGILMYGKKPTFKELWRWLRYA